VVGDRRGRDAKPRGDLALRQTVGIEAEDFVTSNPEHMFATVPDGTAQPSCGTRTRT
jgi:hypothetical protein